ncbi:MAG: hypothetical protein DBX59_01945 [Bacillota bacterium]|nr:MAG: hypothetical protein DBX59_01945 [Bacillota bacterium]
MELHKYFNGVSVMQRDMPFCVKGFSAVGRVTVNYDGKEYSAVSENGAFSVPCPSHAGSFAPCAFTVRDESGETLSFTARFGDVLLCAGQSNMEYCIEGLSDKDGVLARCAEAQGIYFVNTYGTLSDESGNLLRSETPLADFVGDVEWKPISDESAKYLSAVAALAALELAERANAPIGLVCNPVGGVQICAYLPQSLIEGDELVKNNLTERGFYSANGFNTYGFDNYTQPCGLYNERIAPLAGCSFKAMLWYQGESDARDFARADYTRRALKGMIKHYRALFGEKMIFAAAHIAREIYPLTPDGYNYVNEATDIAVREINAEYGDENAFAAPQYDGEVEWLIPDGRFGYNPIHPVSKTKISRRLAKGLENRLYGGEPYRFPEIEFVRFEGGTARVFVRADMPLKGGAVYGFALAEKGGVYAPALARVVSEREIEVRHPMMQNPVALTYAYCRYNQYCNLQTADGMPVKPYRTAIEDVADKAYYQTNWWEYCAFAEITENNNSAESGAFLPRKVWSAGSITGGKAEVSIAQDGLRVAGEPKQREYFFFGASPLIDLCGNPHRLENFSSLQVCMTRLSGDARFCGFLVRGGGFVYRFEPTNIEWNGERKVFNVDLTNACAGDGAPNDREILRTAHAAEFYFRGKEKTEILIEWALPAP